jgi:beta-glucosidase
MNAREWSLESLADALDLDELAAITSGEDSWRTVPLPEDGVPRLKMSDGPVGVRGESFTSTTSALFPCGSALGASFDPDLIERVGQALGDEAHTKGAHVLLGPTLNIQRHPLGGRNFESFGEDPLLVARTAVALVTGLQSRGVAACVKHLVANDAELERLTISSEVDERTLREVYLRPFEAAVVDGGAWSMMASYNRVNGVFACENRWLLTDVVRGEWGFDGLLVSDWFATHDTVLGASAGLDLEMPGPARHFGAALAAAVRSGEVREETVRAMARHQLRLAQRVEAGPADEDRAERSVDDPARWALAVESATAAMVLLRNAQVDGRAVLPIDPATVRRVAVIGPNADAAIVQGGGSARVTPHRTVTPLAGVTARLSPGVDVLHTTGCARGHPFPVLDSRLTSTEAGPGIRVEYRRDRDGPVQATTDLLRFDPMWSGRFHPAVDPEHFHARATATLTPEVSGLHAFDLTSVGPCLVTIDGNTLLDNREPTPGTAFFGYGSVPITASADLVTGQPYQLDIDYDRAAANPAMAAVRIGMQPPLGADPIGDAAALAAASDVAIVVVGTNEDVETEAVDRTTMSLPGDQDDLVRRVVAANPRTVVVINAGAPVDMPWADEAGAIVVTWFGGMAAGEALARVLVGDDEPRGRMPVTVPFDLADAPCDISKADPPGELRYTEGLAVGHRWYLDRGTRPRWWFGAGTGYTTFEWGTPSAPRSWTPGEPLELSVPLRNTGARAGSEVVQAYLHRPASRVARPRWVLGGFARVTAAPGADATARLVIDPAALRHWHAGDGWQIEPGPLDVRVARSAGDPGTVVSVDVHDPAG